MVIQRWQSVFLFLAAILLGISMFLSVAEVTIAGKVISYAAIDSMVSLALGVVSVILSVLTIFLYKNLSRQIKTTSITTLLSLIYIVTSYIMAYKMVDDIQLRYSGLCAVLAIIFQIAAFVRMRSDEKKLKSYDRIR